MDYRVTLSSFPTTYDEMIALPEASLTTPEAVVALTVASLLAYDKSPEECFKMLDFLRGPRPLSTFEKQFLRDRLGGGRTYIARSYLEGAIPDNDYTPSVPYTVRTSDSFSQIADPGYKKFDVYSGGADTPRPVTLRNKPSTGQWFLWEQILIVDIRVKKSEDPWAYLYTITVI